MLLCGVGGKVCAQDLGKVDSLKKVLEGKSGRGRSEVLWELATVYLDVRDNIAALTCIQEAYDLSKQPPVDSLWLVHMGRVNVKVLARMERYGEALAVLDTILPVARRNSFDLETSLCLGSSGAMYSMLGKYDKALISNLECLSIREKLGDRENISVTENNIGFVYYKIGNYAKALEYFLRSVASKRAAGSHYDEDLAYINIGLCYKYLGKTELAFQYVKKAMSLCGANCSDGVVMDGTLALGSVYWDLKQPELATQNLMLCYNVAVRTGSRRYQAESLVCLGRQANNSEAYRKALKYLKESEHTALLVKSRNLTSQTYHELFRASKGINDYAKAAQYWDKYQLYGDSLLNETLGYQLITTQVEFEQKRNLTKLALQESTVQWQGRQNFWIALIGGLLIIAIELLIYDYTGRKRENQILEAMVHDRTRILEQKIRTLERRETERTTWEQKIDRSFRDGNTRLDALGDIVAHTKIKTAIRNFRGAQQTDPLKTSAET